MAQQEKPEEKLLVETYGAYLKRYPLPTPKIHHDFYGLKCLFVNVTEEPYVGNPQVRFCEGR